MPVDQSTPRSADTARVVTYGSQVSHRLAAAAVLLAVAAPLSACSIGTPTLDAADVEKTIDEELTAQIGRSPDAVDCPDDLTGEVGASLTCTLTDGDQTYDVEVTVTSVKDSDVNFDIQVADQPS